MIESCSDVDFNRHGRTAFLISKKRIISSMEILQLGSELRTPSAFGLSED